jgi:mannose-6-phosphate isomerase-like protein (cupin superfamily)
MAGPVKEFEVHPYVQFMLDKYSPYKRWIESEGVPIIGGAFVRDVRTEKLGNWQRKGCKGAICTFSDQMVADAYIAEIDPGKSTTPQRQLYEEIITVAAGRGATSVWYDGTTKRTFEWERGSTFAIPLNAWHQHFNASGIEPCRYFALTSQPVAFELYRDPEFIYNTNYQFKDRFDSDDPEFFSKEGQYFTEYYGGILHSNFIPDIRKINLVPREKRGKGTRNMYIHMSGSAMLAHVSQFPVGRYKKAHRHGGACFCSTHGLRSCGTKEKNRNGTIGTRGHASRRRRAPGTNTTTPATNRVNSSRFTPTPQCKKKRKASSRLSSRTKTTR